MTEYIERDSTLMKMWNALYALEDKREQEQGLDVYRRLDIQAGFEAGQQTVVNIPAADVAPVKRGMWIHEKDTDWSGGGKTECSVCKYGYADGAYLDVEDFNYCPHCGAKIED